VENPFRQIGFRPRRAAALTWFRISRELRQLRIAELRPIVALIKEDADLLQALRTDAALPRDSGILAAYLAKIRADGIAKHADTKQRLDRLAENNSAILALVNVYAPYARTGEFGAESQKFVRYAIAWRDRWNSVMELFMAGGNYPVTGTQFPKELAAAVDVEMSKVAKMDWSL
jgi:hypothetical protein